MSRVPSVFLSYSHQNGPAARRLLERLEATERVRVVIDKRDIHPSEPWAPRLVSLIQAADKVICLLSPEWSASEVCRWEAVHSAMTCKKHVIPVVLQRACIDGRMVLPPAPPEIETLHYIFFDDPQEYEGSLWTLLHTIEQDIGWVREHTRLGELAYRWDRPVESTKGERRRSRDKLLRGKELVNAERWLQSQPLTAPPPTPLHREFIEQSRRAATRLEHGLIATVSLVGVSIASLGAWALLQQGEAEHQRSIAEQTEERAESSEQVARHKKAEALVQQSLAATRRHETTHAIELAVAAAELADAKTMLEVERALYFAIWGHHEVRRVDLKGVASDAAFDDHGHVVVYGENERSYYDMSLDWMRSEPRTGPRSSGLGGLWGVLTLRGATKHEAPSDKRSWRRIDRDIDIVHDRKDDTLRVLLGKREAWSMQLMSLNEVMIDPNGRVIVFGAYADYPSSDSSTSGTYSGTLKFLETSNPVQYHVLGELESLDRDWHDHVAISPTGDTIVYADPVPAMSGQWREPLVFNTLPGTISGARGDAGSVRATLGGHGQSLTSVDYFRDGSRILTLVPGGTLRLWSPDVFVDEEALASHHGVHLDRARMDTSPPPDIVNPRMRSFHRDVVSGAVVVAGTAGKVTASLDGRVVYWPSEDAPPVVLYDDRSHPPVALANSASAEDVRAYFLTIDGLHRVSLEGVLERVASFEEIYSSRDGNYRPGATLRVVTGLLNNDPLVEIGTGRGIGFVVDVSRREILWKGPCADRPRVDARMGTLLCPLVPEQLERHQWPTMLYRRDGHLVEHDPYDPLVPVREHIEVLPVGECRCGVVGGALFDFERGHEIVRLAEVPGLVNSKIEGLPVFCSTDDLVGYARELLAGVSRPGTPNPKPEALTEAPSPVEIPLPKNVQRPASPTTDPLALVGRHPAVLLQTEWVRVKLNALLGADLPEFESRLEVAADMERDGQLVVASACMAHLCTMEEVLVVIEVPTADLHVAILTCPQQVRVYGPEGVPPPARFEALVAEMRARAEPECG